MPAETSRLALTGMVEGRSARATGVEWGQGGSCDFVGFPWVVVKTVSCQRYCVANSPNRNRIHIVV